MKEERSMWIQEPQAGGGRGDGVDGGRELGWAKIPVPTCFCKPSVSTGSTGSFCRRLASDSTRKGLLSVPSPGELDRPSLALPSARGHTAHHRHWGHQNSGNRFLHKY